jgi:hypothetical protein
MRLLSSAIVFLNLVVVGNAFDLAMSGRSPLSSQYKSIMSIHRGLTSGGGSGSYYSSPRMAPPGEPEPEVRPIRLFFSFPFPLPPPTTTTMSALYFMSRTTMRA